MRAYPILCVLGVVASGCGQSPSPIQPDDAHVGERDGGGAQSPSDAGADVGAADAGAPRGLARIYVTASTGELGGYVNTRITFEPSGPGARRCNEQTVGACTIVDCEGSDTGTLVSGGEVRFTRGESTLSFTPTGEHYEATRSHAGLFAREGDRIDVTGAGASAPAFAASVVVPGPVRTSSLRNEAGVVRHAEGTDLYVTWAQGGTGQHVIDLISETFGGSGHRREVKCSYPASAGAAIVPWSLIPFSDGTDRISVYVFGEGLSVQEVDGWQLRVASRTVYDEIVLDRE